MRLYWHPFSLIPWRVRIALHEKRATYEEVKVDVYTSPQRSPEFLRLNPFGQIPVLEDDGLVIAESLAILEYLEERYATPALMPVDVEARATARQWMCWSTDYWPPAWKKWIAPRIPGGAWTNESVSEGRREIAAHLEEVSTRPAVSQWVDRLRQRPPVQATMMPRAG